MGRCVLDVDLFEYMPKDYFRLWTSVYTHLRTVVDVDLCVFTPKLEAQELLRSYVLKTAFIKHFTKQKY